MPLRLLCICAHPDDECFAFGGTLALYAARGVETSVLCLTDGQAATHRGDASSGKQLGQTRRAEFEASCKVLGVANAQVLDYSDGKLSCESFEDLGGVLARHIRELRPHIVISFGPDGGLNTHPDHTTVALAATAAFHWAGSPKRFITTGNLWQPQRLYYLTGSFFSLIASRRCPRRGPTRSTSAPSSTKRRKPSRSTHRRRR